MSEVRVVTITEAELDALVRRAVAEALAEHQVAPATKLLDREGLCQALDISLASLHRLRQESGFPELKVGDSPRFELEAVLAWLRERGQ